MSQTTTLEKPRLDNEQVAAINGITDEKGDKIRHGIWDYLIMIFGDELGGDPHFLQKFIADSEMNILGAAALRQKRLHLEQCWKEGTKPEIPE